MKGARASVAAALVLAALAAAGCGSDSWAPPAPPGPEPEARYRVMTYNILVALPNPDYDPWSVRAGHVAAAITRHDPDLVGLQEPIQTQIDDLLELAPGYAALPLSVLDTDAAILYRAERFEPLDHWIYWLSPTPDVPHSTGFGNFIWRMVLNVRMRDLETGTEFFFVNTHFDNTPPSQVLSAPLFLERTEPLARELPVVITGDFNSKPDSEAYQILTHGVPGGDGFALQDTFFLAPGYEVEGRPGDDLTYDPAHRIDHIFVPPGPYFGTRWLVDKTTYGPDRKEPSDHYPIVADVGWW